MLSLYPCQLGQNSVADLGVLLELLTVAVSSSTKKHALRTALISREAARYCAYAYDTFLGLLKSDQ